MPSLGVVGDSDLKHDELTHSKAAMPFWSIIRITTERPEAGLGALKTRHPLESLREQRQPQRCGMSATP